MKALHFFSFCLLLAVPAAADSPGNGFTPVTEATAWTGRSATVLVFLFPDCPIANRFAPEINAIYADYHEKGVAFFRVYAGAHIEPGAVEAHTDEYSHRSPAVLDPDLDLVRLTGARVTPEAVVLDAEGTQRYRGRINNRYVDFRRYRPEPTVHDLRDALDAVLAGDAVAEPVTEAIGCFLPVPPDKTDEHDKD
jgi:hypothetical protein